jgi:uncharacterized oxidoreductase
MRIPYYVDAVAKGDILSGAEWEVVHESDSHLVIDAHWGFGHVTALRMTDALMARAQAGGVGIGTMRQSGHIGRLGQYAEIAAGQGLVSMSMVNSNGAVHRVAPPGGKASRLGTNPICIGAPLVGQTFLSAGQAGKPAPRETPLILDFSTAATAEGKVRVKWIAKQQVPEGCLIDSEGRATCDAAVLYTTPVGAIVPFGGPQAYKAFGLGLMIEVLCGALSGGLTSREKRESPLGNCVFMMVVDPAHFGGTDHFAREVKQLAEFVRACPRAEGCEEILLPGDPERRIRAKRAAEGIPLDEENWKKLVDLAERLGVKV